MFWENYSELCKKKGVSPNKAAAEIGISSGSVTAWKNGRLPRSAALVEISEYFGVTVEDLLSKKEKPSEDGEPKSEYDVQLSELWETLSDEQKKYAIDFIRLWATFSSEQMKASIDFMNMFKK